MNEFGHDPAIEDETVLETVRTGLRVWSREMLRLVGRAHGQFEISRLRKRLDEEYLRLGHIAEAPRGRKEEKERVLRQIAFLKEEIGTLERELDEADGRAN